MNSLALLVAVATLGVDYGWQTRPDGGVDYLLHLEAATLEHLRTGAIPELSSEIDRRAGAIRGVKILAGDDVVARRPTLTRDATPPSTGWRVRADGGVEFLVQLSPTTVADLLAGSISSVAAEIDPQLGEIAAIRLVTGVAPLPREQVGKPAVEGQREFAPFDAADLRPQLDAPTLRRPSATLADDNTPASGSQPRELPLEVAQASGQGGVGSQWPISRTSASQPATTPTGQNPSSAATQPATGATIRNDSTSRPPTTAPASSQPPTGAAAPGSASRSTTPAYGPAEPAPDRSATAPQYSLDPNTNAPRADDRWQPSFGGSPAQSGTGQQPAYDPATDPRFTTTQDPRYQDPRLYASDPRYAPDPRYASDPRYATDPRYAAPPTYDPRFLAAQDPRYAPPANYVAYNQPAAPQPTAQPPVIQAPVVQQPPAASPPATPPASERPTFNNRSDWDGEQRSPVPVPTSIAMVLLMFSVAGNVYLAIQFHRNYQRYNETLSQMRRGRGAV